MKTWQKRLTALLLIVLRIAGAFNLAAYAEKKSGQKITTEQTVSEETNKKQAAPKKIKIQGSKYVAKGKKIKLTVTVAPEGANKKVTWKSENPAIATVDSKGIVKGVKAGKTKITATSTVNGKKASFSIQVMEKGVKKVHIIGAPESMIVGQTAKYTYGRALK